MKERKGEKVQNLKIQEGGIKEVRTGKHHMDLRGKRVTAASA